MNQPKCLMLTSVLNKLLLSCTLQVRMSGNLSAGLRSCRSSFVPNIEDRLMNHSSPLRVYITIAFFSFLDIGVAFMPLIAHHS